MSTTTALKSAVINARVEPRHAEQLRAIAERNASTISRTAGRIIAESLDAEPAATLRSK